MNDKKSNFNSYIYTLFLDLHILLWLGETCVNYATQKTLNSCRHDLTSIERYFEQSRRLFFHEVS